MTTTASQAREVLRRRGEASVQTIADELGIDNARSIGQALGHDARQINPQVERVGRGYYRWIGDNPQQTGTSDDLLPLVDWIDDTEAFASCGLKLVARSNDGGFITVDDNMRAWKVEVTVTARML